MKNDALGSHKHLIVMVGLPYSGKSTWARKTGLPIVCPDAIREAMHGQRFFGPAEPLVWATARLMVRSLFMAGHTEVILDATSVTRKRRDNWQGSEWTTLFMECDASAELCIQRAKSADDEEIIPVIERMEKQAEPLSPTELRWYGVA